MIEKRIRIIVSGKVQGVWFRQSTVEKARALKLKGWVKNLSNGDVEVLAEGIESDLNRLIEWCKKGPPLAKVESVDVKEEPAIGDLTDFYIKR